MKNDTKREADPPGLGKQILEITGHPVWISLVTETETPGKAFDVGIHGNARWNIERFTQHHFGGLPADPRQADHALERSWKLPAMVGDQRPSSVTKGSGLVPEESCRVNDFLDLRHISSGHRLGSRPEPKKLRCYQIDPNVGALGRENRCRKELPGCFEIQLTPSIRIEQIQTPGNLGRALFPACHSLKVLPPMNSLSNEVWGTSSGNTGTNIESPLSKR